MVAQFTTADTEHNASIAAELAGEGRVEVTPTRRTDFGDDVETPAGVLKLAGAKPQGSHTRGSDYTRYYNIGGYTVSYSIDGTPENATFSILVEDE